MELVRDCVNLSPRYVQPGTTVLDLGCSTGHLLASVRRINRVGRPDVEYVGIDREPGFMPYWDGRRTKNLQCRLADARTYPLSNVSLSYSLFTMQFELLPV